jgi:hypothetical protein
MKNYKINYENKILYQKGFYGYELTKYGKEKIKELKYYEQTPFGIFSKYYSYEIQNNKVMGSLQFNIILNKEYLYFGGTNASRYYLPCELKLDEKNFTKKQIKIYKQEIKTLKEIGFIK